MTEQPDLIKRAEALIKDAPAGHALGNWHRRVAFLFPSLLAALKAARAENELLREDAAVKELVRILREANTRGDYDHFAQQLVESGRIAVRKTYEQAMDELRAAHQ